MSTMNWRDRISLNPSVCHGKPCITGTRILISAILDNLASGISLKEILRSYPSLTENDVHATLKDAAEKDPM